jgi:hypothetical protein
MSLNASYFESLEDIQASVTTVLKGFFLNYFGQGF